MKKSMIIFGFLICISQLTAQSYVTLSLGGTNSSTLLPGDTISVPIYCVDITPGAIVLSLQFVFEYDHSVLEWTDSVQFYLGEYGDWLFGDDGTYMTILWIDPTFSGGQPILPGEMFCEMYFIYYGGETQLNWEPETSMSDQNFNYFELTLLNGCVCVYDTYMASFHVTSDGNDLENAVVSVGGQSDTTDVMGIADFMLPDGNYVYTVTKEGYTDVVDSITVVGAPVQVEVEMEVCSDVNFHIVSFSGAITGCVITIGNYIFNTDTMSTVCLPAGTYSFSVSKPGYYTFTGTLTAPFGPDILVIILIPIYYDVTFYVNCCGEPLENYPISYEGQTVVTNAAGIAVMNLPSGFYSFEIGGFPVTFTLPDTNFVDVDICSEVTFHVTDDDGNPLEGVLIEIDNINLFTDINGEAYTCLPIGTYQYLATKYNYGPQSGTFDLDTIPQMIEIVMPLITYSVTFNIISSCENGYNGWYISINGELYEPGDEINLPSGSYYYVYGYLDCSATSGMLFVNSSNVFINCITFEPHATFHVSSSLGGNLQGAIVDVDTFSLVTNYSGDASFCLPGGSFNYSVTKEGYGTYSGIFSYINYCQDTVVEILMDPVLVNNYNSSEIRLYPNPSGGMFFLENLNSDSNLADITIKDISGRIVYQENSVSSNKVEIDLKNQPKGMYFIRAKTGENILNEKLVVQ